MSIVPKEVVASIAAAWNLECGETFAAHIANRAAQWALEMAAKACGQVAASYNEQGAMHHVGGADACAEAIRSLISPEGKLKGGESDGQE